MVGPLGFIPERVEGGDVQVFQIETAFAGHALDETKPAPELGVRPTKCLLGFDVEVVSDIDEHEKDVAELVGTFGSIGGAGELLDFLTELVEWAINVRPIESNAPGPALDRL
jgi:hypothetical protein